MNKKILLIATLVLLAFISIGSISAAEDIADDAVSAGDVDAVSEDIDEAAVGEGETPQTTTIEITEGMTEAQIQEQFNNLQNNTVINFQTGTYTVNNLTVKGDKDGGRLSNIVFNGNGATLTGTPAKGNQTNHRYYNGIFEINKIDGFTITGFNFKALNSNGNQPGTPSCVVVSNCTNGIIEENDFQGGRFGLYVGNKKNDFGPAPTVDITIRFNNVSNVGDMGIISFGAERTQILNNTITNPANHGIDVRFKGGQFTNVTVKGNIITGAQEAIYIMHSAGHKVLENTISNSTIGITCFGSNNVTCDYNNFAENVKIGHFLASGYENITIGNNNLIGGIIETKMPPTFPYFVVKGDSNYLNENSTVVTYTDNADTHMTYVQALYVNDLDILVDLNQGGTTVISDELLAKNPVLTFKIWKFDDRNHIDADETVNVIVDKTVVKLTSQSGGDVYLDITGLTKGQHDITVYYAGNDDLEPCTWTGTIQIGSDETSVSNQTATSIAANAMAATAKISSTLSVTLKDANNYVLANKEITYSVNGVTKTVKTDANGVAKIAVNMVAGTYHYALAYLGDDDYKASFKTVKVTVNKQAVKVKFAKATLKVKKTKKVKFTLLDSKGKGISGKKISITVNGKTFKGTTNSKGVATIKVKVTKKGKKYATAKFAGDNVYKAISKKVLFTVK